VQTAAVRVAPATTPPAATASSFDAIPLPICWTLCGISAVALIIQIWNYLLF